jgi:hypothetical protein
MSCESSCENGLDAIAGRGREVGVGPLATEHAAATDRVLSMSQAQTTMSPDLRSHLINRLVFEWVNLIHRTTIA